jgi:hypothetical protein
MIHEECQHAYFTQNQSPQQRYMKRIYSTVIMISDSIFFRGTWNLMANYIKLLKKMLSFLITALFVIWHLTCSV